MPRQVGSGGGVVCAGGLLRLHIASPSSATAGVSGITLATAGGGVKRVADATAITAGTGTPPPSGDDYWAVLSDHDGKLYRWISAAGAYTRTTDGADIVANTIAVDRLIAANEVEPRDHRRLWRTAARTLSIR